MSKKLLEAAAGNAGESLYVEDVFSTYLYTGTGAAQTITNGIDLDGDGGMVWIKSRNNATTHTLHDTARGPTKRLRINTDAETTVSDLVTSFNSDGFTLGADVGNSGGNFSSAYDYASWTFRKAEKFFDVVTYTGTGGIGYRQIAHNLGSTPAAVILKNTTDVQNWYVYHKDTAQVGDTDYATHGAYMNLNAATAKAFSNTAFPKVGTSSGGVTAVYDSSVFTIGEDLNTSGKAYVLYLFASDAGGFGDDGSENIIKCGSVSYNGGATVDLGFEPQWVLVKTSDAAGNWVINDNMRGMPNGSRGPRLDADTSNAELANATVVYPTATGFIMPSALYDPVDLIYIAIRRPMKTPESGTEVFAPIARTGTGTTAAVTGVGFAPDMLLQARRTAPDWPTSDRLRGVGQNLGTAYTSAENTPSPAYVESYDMDGATLGSGNAINGSGLTYIDYFFKRATGFFDVVAYTGTGVARTVSHNLGAVPELMILKVRNRAGSSWVGYHKDLGNEGGFGLDSFAAFSGVTSAWNSTTPNSSVFTVGTGSNYNGNTDNLIAYLFATLAGVSKVGSYTGTGSNVDVNCGFSAGARFILIKRTDSTGDWYVYDSARGIVAGNDPYLLLNSTAAEATTTDYIDPLSSGFTVTSTAPAALNASGGTYIYLAIA